MQDAKLAGDRVDLVKRLFAVTISVGFATQLSKIIFDPRYVAGPELNIVSIATDHWRDGLLLLVAMVAVVASWEGYLKAVDRSPLEDRGRFYIDIILVFFYLILMLSSQIFHLWFHLLWVIFVLYTIWDIARIIVEPRTEPRASSQASLAITLVWLGFFIVLDCLRDTVGGWAFAGAAASAFLGMVLYRIDKWQRFNWAVKVVLVVLALVPAMLLPRL
jgi:hypothetical protein